VKFSKIPNEGNSRKLASKLTKTCEFSDLAFFAQARFPVNSEVARLAWKLLQRHYGSQKENSWVWIRRVWGPQILYSWAKSCTNCVFRQNWSLWTRVTFLLFHSIFLLPVWPKLHVGHPFLLIKHASHFCTLFQLSTRSANVRYYYFRFSRYRALAPRLRSRWVWLIWVLFAISTCYGKPETLLEFVDLWPLELFM